MTRLGSVLSLPFTSLILIVQHSTTLSFTERGCALGRLSARPAVFYMWSIANYPENPCETHPRILSGNHRQESNERSRYSHSGFHFSGDSGLFSWRNSYCELQYLCRKKVLLLSASGIRAKLPKGLGRDGRSLATDRRTRWHIAMAPIEGKHMIHGSIPPRPQNWPNWMESNSMNPLLLFLLPASPCQ